MMMKTRFMAACAAGLLAACTGAAEYDLLVVGDTVRAVDAAIAAKQAGKNVYLLAHRGYLGEDVAGTMTGVTKTHTPLDVKRELDKKLLAAGVPFHTWTPVSAIDADGATVTTREKEYRVTAKETVDLRAWRVDAKAPRAGRKIRATRVVVSGEKPDAAQCLAVEELATLDEVKVYKPAKGYPAVFTPKVWRCTLELTLPENTVRGRLAAEQEARARTWTALELDAADRCLAGETETFAPCGDLECDVLVVGMGTGGAPATIAAARAGAKTIVVEWAYRAGGLTTEGLISNYWYGNVCGFTSEIDEGHRALGPCHYSTKSEWFRREAVKAGAEILFGTLATDVIKEGNRIVGVWAVMPTGEKVRIRCRNAIDATGNAVLAAAAGEETEFINADELAVQGAAFVVKKLGQSYGNEDFTFIDDTDVDDLCYLSLRGRLSYRPHLWDQSQVVDTRERRRMRGVFYVTPRDVMNHRTYPDVICVTRSNFDTHGETVDPQFFIDDPPHQPPTRVNLPYRAILPKKTDGLLVIGLGMSAHRDAMPILRMQPDVQNQGYAAGWAAATSVKEGVPVRAIDVKALQRHLIEKKILEPYVLRMRDSYPLAAAEYPKAVASLTNAYEGLTVAMTDPSRSLPLLREAYAAAGDAPYVIPVVHPHELNPAEDAITSTPRVVYAHVLAMMGDATGAETLRRHVAANPWDWGWNYRGMNQLFRSVGWMDSYVIALGRCRAPGGDAEVRAKAAALTADDPYSHFRAVALALESYGGAENAAALAKLLRLPGVAGHAFDRARDGVPPMPRYGDTPGGRRVKPGVPDKERSDCLRELALARALCRCGDADGLGRRTLEAYAKDPRRAYANHAAQVLGSLRAALPLVPWPAEVRETEGVAVNAPVVCARDAALGPEAYRLVVQPHRIAITSATDAGEFYARRTLDQLRRADGTCPCVEISDAPRFAWRGVLLDESRHFFGKETVKRILDRMAQFKLNVFHWHLVDSHGWRIQIDRHPELTARGAVRPVPDWDHWIRDADVGHEYGPYFYTKADIREIVAYAAARHIRIVPEVELPGHSREVILCHADFSCMTRDAFMDMIRSQRDQDQAAALCLGNDAVIRFLEDVIDEVCELFPGEIVHIGGDECPRANWKKCPKCQARMKAFGLKSEDELQSWATKHFVAYLAKKGRKTIGWDEILQGGLAPGAIVMSWRGAEGGIAAANAGHEVVMCPHRFCYLDYRTCEKDDVCPYPRFAEKSQLPLEKVYSLDPLEGIPAEQHRYILGSQTLNWTESTWNERDLEYKMWPRTCANAEIAWTGAKKRDFADFKARLAPIAARCFRRNLEGGAHR